MRRPARRIYVVLVQQSETDTTEDWTAEYRFTSERAAKAFAAKARRHPGLDYVGDPYPSPLWHSAKAAYDALREDVSP
jgi:hypothetical protein